MKLKPFDHNEHCSKIYSHGYHPYRYIQEGRFYNDQYLQVDENGELLSSDPAVPRDREPDSEGGVNTKNLFNEMRGPAARGSAEDISAGQANAELEEQLAEKQ